MKAFTVKLNEVKKVLNDRVRPTPLFKKKSADIQKIVRRFFYGVRGQTLT